MAYNKTTWVSGETLLSAENFNKMEQGIEDAHIAVSNIQNTLSNVNDDVTSIKTAILTLTTDINTLKQTVNTLDEIVEGLLIGTEPPLGDNIPDSLPKLATPVIYLEEESLPEAPESSNTTAILGKAILGKMVLGNTGIILPKLNTPIIRLIDDEMVLERLSTPRIYLETIGDDSEEPKLKLNTPNIYLENIEQENPEEPRIKLTTPSIFLHEDIEPIKTFTFLIEPTPYNAIVTLTSEDAVQQGNSIEVKEGSIVQWKVELSGYETQEGSEVITSSITKEISLVYIKPKLNTPEIYLETINNILDTPIIYLENI